MMNWKRNVWQGQKQIHGLSAKLENGCGISFNGSGIAEVRA
jgi:hypothetical protein